MIQQGFESKCFVIGIDLDNTLVIYDKLLRRLAFERGFISSGEDGNKKEVRDILRNMPNGEIEWQKLQGVMYGPRIGEASFSPQIYDFVKLCKSHKAEIRIISHKTEYANFDETNTNLRQAAIQWMTDHKFFDATGLGLSQKAVHFVGTRQAKSEAISMLGCTHFIDDLEEVFQEPSFPSNVKKILFAPQETKSCISGVTIAANWTQVGARIFPDRN